MTASFTNTAPVDAYRGAGRPEATYVVERIVHQAAVDTGIAQDEIRRRNFIRKFPYATPVALTYDIGNYDATLDDAMKVADVAGFPARKADAAKRGMLRGLGYASYIEACGLAPSNVAGALGARAGLFEAGQVRVNPTGSVTVFTGSHSHGQGHETTFAQVVAGRLGIDIANVEVVHGDTGRIPFGMGTYGSRSLSVGGTAIVKALDKVIAKGKKIAAHLLEAAEADIEFKDGKFTVAGTDRSKAFAEVSLAAYVPHNYPLDKLEPGLDETAFYDPTNFTYPAGTHICEVEVDPETGVVKVVNFTASDDFGNIINPMIVAGQVHGGADAGHRPGAARSLRVRRRQRPVADRQLHGLRDAAGRRRAVVQRVHAGHAVHAQSARRKRLRRGRRDRRAGGDDERRPRRAGGGRRQAHRHAGVAAPCLAGHPISPRLKELKHVRIRTAQGRFRRQRRRAAGANRRQAAGRRPEPRRRDEDAPGGAGRAGRPLRRCRS